MARLTHLDDEGKAHMVDVGAKPSTRRTATAVGRVDMSAAALAALAGGSAPKGDVLSVARVAGIMAAKRTSELVPLCHPLRLDRVAVDLAVEGDAVVVRAEVAATGPTGVEMEALTAVSVACLVVYDMVKSLDRAMTIGPIRLVHKAGGRSGPWSAP